MSPRRLLAVCLALLAILAAACAGDGEGATAGVPSAAPTDRATPDVLAFTATTVGGGTFDGAEYAGQDLMLWFWAPW